LLIENETKWTASYIYGMTHPRHDFNPFTRQMSEYLQISASEAFFLADAHFLERRIPGEAARRDSFIRFSECIPSGAALFLLGDIFDFYFGYVSVAPKNYFDILHALQNCRERGVDIHFLGGNHDFWVDDFLSDQLGMVVHNDDFLIECQARKIRCAHGDMVVPDDDGYRLLRAILRNPGVIKLSKLIHPDLMFSLAKMVSGRSKNRQRRSQEDTASRLAGLARNHCYKWENDAFVMGHVHHPFHRVFEGRDFVIVGDWIENFSYVRLSDGKLSLETFTD